MGAKKGVKQCGNPKDRHLSPLTLKHHAVGSVSEKVVTFAVMKRPR
jgi:hypothetical protein